MVIIELMLSISLFCAFTSFYGAVNCCYMGVDVLIIMLSIALTLIHLFLGFLYAMHYFWLIIFCLCCASVALWYFCLRVYLLAIKCCQCLHVGDNSSVSASYVMKLAATTSSCPSVALSVAV
jgi:hypothetical protein